MLVVTNKSATWFTNKLLQYQQAEGERKTIGDFAKHMGNVVSEASLGHYLNGRRDPSYNAAFEIAKELGDFSLLEVLGYAQPVDHSSLPADFRRRLEAAEEEVNRTLEERGLTGEMPEAETITISIFEKWGFKYVSTETVDDSNESSTK